MSYEGYTEYITKDGYYFARDAYDYDTPPTKPYWIHEVDCTNGIVDDAPGTQEGLKRVVGSVDIPQIDHLGNKYYTRKLQWAPDGPGWRWVQ